MPPIKTGEWGYRMVLLVLIGNDERVGRQTRKATAAGRRRGGQTTIKRGSWLESSWRPGRDGGQTTIFGVEERATGGKRRSSCEERDAEPLACSRMFEKGARAGGWTQTYIAAGNSPLYYPAATN